MAIQALDPRKRPVPGAVEPSEDELIRLLVARVSGDCVDGCPPHAEGLPGAEEIILDVDLDGARYLLIRMPKAEQPRVQLSPRELEIVRMVAQGHPNKVIADVLSISCWTVSTYLRRVFAKLGVGSRAAMVARMMETKSNPPATGSRVASIGSRAYADASQRETR
jgi:DNA-binding CsgD family transcriptional regulator